MATILDVGECGLDGDELASGGDRFPNAACAVFAPSVSTARAAQIASAIRTHASLAEVDHLDAIGVRCFGPGLIFASLPSFAAPFGPGWQSNPATSQCVGPSVE